MTPLPLPARSPAADRGLVQPLAPAHDDLIVRRPEGLYCPPGDFYIDPWRPVDRAVITHAHADHARRGHAHYLGAAAGEGVLRARLGEIDLQTLAYGAVVDHFGVRVSLHPAGHVLGSAQVRLEHRGRVWVASGDYFVAGAADDAREDNASCTPFEPVRCDVFITESTFGLPIYRWAPQRETFTAINAWWAANADAGRASLLLGYSFGKAQRILMGVDASIGPIVVHGAVEPLNRAYRAGGIALPDTQVLAPLNDKSGAKSSAQSSTKRLDRTEREQAASALKRALVIAPPSVQNSAWARRFGADTSDAFASGWMQLRGARRRRSVDRGFVLSDHADWPGLQRAIRATGAQRVIVTHGYEAVMVRWLREQGLEAGAFETEYGAEEDGHETRVDAGAGVSAESAAEPATEPADEPGNVSA